MRTDLQAGGGGGGGGGCSSPKYGRDENHDSGDELPGDQPLPEVQSAPPRLLLNALRLELPFWLNVSRMTPSRILRMVNGALHRQVKTNGQQAPLVELAHRRNARVLQEKKMKRMKRMETVRIEREKRRK
jgi:hypothetical protein